MSALLRCPSLPLVAPGFRSLVKRSLPVLLGSALGLLCAGCTSSPNSGARIAAVVLHASGPSHPQVSAGPADSRPSDFALPHGRGGQPYIEALPPGAIAHDRRGI